MLSPNLVISYYIYQIRHLIIISALEKKSRENVGCSFCIERFHEKNKEKTKNANRKRSDCEKKNHRRKRKKSKSKKNRAKCQTNPIWLRTSVISLKNNWKEMVFSLKKTKIIKRIPFIPPTHPLNRKKNEQQKKSPYSNEKLKKKNPLHYLFVQLQKRKKNSNKVTNFERIKKKTWLLCISVY